MTVSIAEPRGSHTTGEFAPPDCAICERSLLVGEALRLFRDRNERLVKVCVLCRERAGEAGLESLGPTWDTPRLRVQASGSVRDIVERDALIEGLGHELAYLRQQLESAELALQEQSRTAQAIDAVTDKLQRQERELDRLRAEHDPVQRAQERRQLAAQGAELQRLRQALAARDADVTRLQAARRIETDTVAICRAACDAFNSSESADRMLRISRTLDDPHISVRDLGPGLPRLVEIVLSWDIAWYAFTVKLDLGAGKASVHEAGNGGDPRKLAPEQRRDNAVWRTGGIVLR